MRTHTLLRVAAASILRCDTPLPGWVTQAPGRALWVVVRRAPQRDGLIPVGTRGARRSERFAAWLHPADVLEALDPIELAARRGWRGHPRCAGIAALAALAGVEQGMERVGLASCWGPTGSVGFELASGHATATPASDLDLMVRADEPLASTAAAALLAALTALPARIDVLLETPRGAVALAESVHARGPVVLRTVNGARLVADPWSREAAAA